MPNIDLKRAERLSTWRKVSVATWGAPSDPTIYGLLDVDCGRLLPLLEKWSVESGSRVTLTHAVARALAIALSENPELNAVIRWGRIYERRHVDIFLQVAVVEDGNNPDLSGCKIEDAHKKNISLLASEVRARAQGIRRGDDQQLKASKKRIGSMPGIVMRPLTKLLSWLTYTVNLDARWFGLPKDTFGSAMVTSVGMFGIRVGFAPLFPPAHCPILVLVGALEDRPVAFDGQVVIRPIVTLTGTFDHRIVDGYHGGVLAKRIKGLLENPPSDF
jgi:pyruvate dehydrogenase E2 component (dihydrolipoamide acetyltransferase)